MRAPRSRLICRPCNRHLPLSASRCPWCLSPPAHSSAGPFRIPALPRVISSEMGRGHDAVARKPFSFRRHPEGTRSAPVTHERRRESRSHASAPAEGRKLPPSGRPLLRHENRSAVGRPRGISGSWHHRKGRSRTARPIRGAETPAMRQPQGGRGNGPRALCLGHLGQLAERREGDPSLDASCRGGGLGRGGRASRYLRVPRLGRGACSAGTVFRPTCSSPQRIRFRACFVANNG